MRKVIELPRDACAHEIVICQQARYGREDLALAEGRRAVVLRTSDVLQRYRQLERVSERVGHSTGWRETYLESRIGLTLAEQITSGHRSRIRVFCEVKIDSAEARLLGRVRISRHHSLNIESAPYTELILITTHLHHNELHFIW